jgi:hypothetical protein
MVSNLLLQWPGYDFPFSKRIRVVDQYKLPMTRRTLAVEISTQIQEFMREARSHVSTLYFTSISLECVRNCTTPEGGRRCVVC